MGTRVSVIIPTANRPEFLAQALGSVRALEGPDLQLEAIVVDDGDDQRTPATAADYMARYVRSSVHGPAGARNSGLRVASGEFVAFLDDDDAWLPGHVRPHIKVMRERPDVAAVFGQIVNFDYELREHASPWPDPFPAGATPFARVFGYQPQIGATVIRATAIATVGDFDEQLLGDEDWDWQLRLALALSVEFVAVPSVAYRCRPDGQLESDELECLRMRFFDRVYWRNVRRAARARPSWPAIVRAYLRRRGQYAAQFMDSAFAHATAGEDKAARRQLVRGLRASPLHSSLWLARQRPAGRAIFRAAALGSGAARP
jgi:glycosyltransferase involved in cell wall biosynthesis